MLFPYKSGKYKSFTCGSSGLYFNFWAIIELHFSVTQLFRLDFSVNITVSNKKSTTSWVCEITSISMWVVYKHVFVMFSFMSKDLTFYLL